MDPRHPEQAIARMRELIRQYDRIENDINKATTSAQLGQLEREGGLVVQEICLVAPRIHEAMMQVSRQRRRDLSHGIVEKPVEKDVNKVEKKVDIEELDVNEISITQDGVVALVEDLEFTSTDTKISDDKTSIETEQTYKSKKKTTRKKKATKKAEK